MATGVEFKVTNFRRLFYFAQIVEAGSIRGAARALSLSPQVLSEAMKELESEVGQPVLVRAGGRLKLTARGTEIHDAALQMIEHATRAIAPPPQVGAAPKTKIRIAIPQSIALYLLPDFMDRFGDALSTIDLSVRADDAELDLDQDDIDLALVPRMTAEPLEGPMILENYDMALYAMPPVAEAVGPVRLEGMAPIPFIGLTTQVSRGLWAREIETGHTGYLPIDPRGTVSNSELARKLAIAGAGVALLARDVLHEDPDAAALKKISHGFCLGYTALELVRGRQTATPAHDLLADAIRHYAEERKAWRAQQRQHAG